MSLHGKRILVAGASGMVGTAIINHFLKCDSTLSIRACYNRIAPYLADKRIEYVQTDLTLQEECRIVAANCDYAVMAAPSSTGFSFVHRRTSNKL